MELASQCFDLLCLTAQGTIHLWFCRRLTRKKRRWELLAVYISLLCLLEWTAGRVSLPWSAAIGSELLLLYGMNRFALGSRPAVSWITAILACYISQFSFGLINSVEAVLFPCMVGTPLLYLIVLAATVLSFAVCAACCAAVIHTLTPEELGGQVGCLLVPILFFFAAELHIMQTSYTQTAVSSALPLADVGRHTMLLVLQALGLGALLCTLYAYRRLCRSLQAQTEMRSLAQAVQAQKVYIAEAQARYEQTKSFRHDIKNHLSVLTGLLHGGRLEESRAYLQKLETAAAALSFPYQTGHPVVDILLQEKLAGAEDIETEVSLLLPRPCGIDGFDLCVIFSNALDNALSACRAVQSPTSLRIYGERQGEFYLLAFENTCEDGPMPPPGIGLANIRSVAEKYHGAMLAEKTERQFSLHILLRIS